jgi:hypothetical protein
MNFWPPFCSSAGKKLKKKKKVAGSSTKVLFFNVPALTQDKDCGILFSDR